jgi:hypothetical protein
MKSPWTKMPDGRLVRRKPNRLRGLLEQAETDIGIPDFEPGPAMAEDSPSANAYATDSFDIRLLAGAEVTIFGAGSVGSYVAYALAPTQPVINIIDFKHVEVKHTRGGRTIYEATSVGLTKVQALKQKIERDHLGACVNPLPYDVAEIPDIELNDLFMRSWVVIVAIDDPGQILRISDLAYPRVELAQVAIHRRGESGHIAVSIPMTTPCLRCTLELDNAGDIRRLDGEPANSLDIVTVAHQAARIAVDIMSARATGRQISRWDTSRNLIYVSNAQQPQAPDGPGLRFESSRRRPDCSICTIPKPS